MPMRLITVHVELGDIDSMDDLVSLARYDNRSEVVRSAIRKLIEEEQKQKESRPKVVTW